jgi:hypothetical protein
LVDRIYRASEIYFNPSLMFNGPFNELSIESIVDKFQIRNRISSVGRSEVDKLLDLAFFKNNDSAIMLLILLVNSVRVTMADMTMNMK